jgi:hypothetical protein
MVNRGGSLHVSPNNPWAPSLSLCSHLPSLHSLFSLVSPPIIMRGDELSVSRPGQGLELLLRHEGVEGGLGRLVPEDDQAARVTNQEAVRVRRILQDALHRPRVQPEGVGHRGHHLVLGKKGHFLGNYL